jgi:hypothetical protein
MGGEGSGRKPDITKSLLENRTPIAVTPTDSIFIPNYSGVKTGDNISKLISPHCQISDTTTQTIANAAVAQAITLNTNDELCFMTHSTLTNTSRIYSDVSGHYMFFVSVICDLALGTNQQIDIWFRKNGVDITNSNTTIVVTGTAKQVISVMIDIDMKDGDYLETMFAGQDTNVRIEATAAQANPTRPVCPSIILTGWKVA